MRNLTAMTPETETTTHYFWGQAHDFEPRNPDMTERVFQQIKTAFLEDVSVFTNQQSNIDLDPRAPQVDINADSGGIQARRIVDRLYAEEQAVFSAARTAAE
jgi:vanillate O-demethylase monooxygenase subunit